MRTGEHTDTQHKLSGPAVVPARLLADEPVGARIAYPPLKEWTRNREWERLNTGELMVDRLCTFSACVITRQLCRPRVLVMRVWAW
jgi:hypothetical protein